MLLWAFFSSLPRSVRLFFFFNDTATTEIYTLSLHDALPILIGLAHGSSHFFHLLLPPLFPWLIARSEEHTSELHHSQISYAVFCLKKKKTRAIICCSTTSLAGTPVSL